MARGTGRTAQGAGRAGLKEPGGVELESELYVGRGGYLHTGIGLIAGVGTGQSIGFVAHSVREESGGDYFPSIGAEFIHNIG